MWPRRRTDSLLPPPTGTQRAPHLYHRWWTGRADRGTSPCAAWSLGCHPIFLDTRKQDSQPEHCSWAWLTSQLALLWPPCWVLPCPPAVPRAHPRLPPWASQGLVAREGHGQVGTSSPCGQQAVARPSISHWPSPHSALGPSSGPQLHHCIAPSPKGSASARMTWFAWRCPLPRPLGLPSSPRLGQADGQPGPYPECLASQWAGVGVASRWRCGATPGPLCPGCALARVPRARRALLCDVPGPGGLRLQGSTPDARIPSPRTGRTVVLS